MPDELLIFPFNGNALEAADCLNGQFRLLAFIDDDMGKRDSSTLDVPVLSRSVLQQHPQSQVIAVPGGPQSFHRRKQVIESLDIPSSRFTTLIHPRASVSSRARLGHNVVIMAGAVVSAEACIGNHVCVLPNSVIHHHCRVDDWTLIGASVTIGGGVHVGPNCYIASGTNIKNDLTVGAGTLIGLGSTVIRDCDPGAVYAGSPCRLLRRADT